MTYKPKQVCNNSDRTVSPSYQL